MHKRFWLAGALLLGAFLIASRAVADPTLPSDPPKGLAGEAVRVYFWASTFGAPTSYTKGGEKPGPEVLQMIPSIQGRLVSLSDQGFVNVLVSDIASEKNELIPVGNVVFIEKIHTETVDSVESVTITVINLQTREVVLSAVAKSTTSGWKNARLVPHQYNQAPANGVYDFDLVAEPPSDPVKVTSDPCILPDATLILCLPQGCTGVIVHSASNQQFKAFP